MLRKYLRFYDTSNTIENMEENKMKPIFDLPLAFTDIETTGLRVGYHEILEIGLVLVDQKTLEVRDEWEIKVAPSHPERAMPSSLAVNGYHEAEWADAVSLEEAIKEYAKRVEGSLLAGWNTRFDAAFLSLAFSECGMDIYKAMDYHAFDVMPLALEALRENRPARFSLNGVAAHLGLPQEPTVHRALNGAKGAFEVYKALRKQA